MSISKKLLLKQTDHTENDKTSNFDQNSFLIMDISISTSKFVLNAELEFPFFYFDGGVELNRRVQKI